MTNSSDIIRKLREVGYQLVRIKGSHHQFRHTSKPGIITVPHPKKNIPVGTVKSILKSAGIKFTKIKDE